MRGLVFALGGVVVLGAVGQAGATDPAINRLAADALRRWDAPGLAVVVVRDGETVHLKGYGRRRLGADDPVTPDTLFPLASCTKAFTSALLAVLADDRQLGWDDPVRKHLPGFRLVDPHADALVTVRDLLTHRTGLGGHDLLWYRAPWGIGETLRRTANLPLDGPFRGGYLYSSLPYLAAGRLAAARGGAAWDELVRDRLCRPLGMTGVAFTTAEAAGKADRAAGHRRAKAGKVEPMPGLEVREPNPAGSVHATARDLAGWLQFHLADGTAGGKRVASKTNLDETKTPHTPMRLDDPGIGPVYPDSVQVSYAMGWVVYDHRGQKVVAHGGIVDGFRAQVTLLPDRKTGFALLNNLHQTKMNVALGNALIDHLCGLPAKDWNAYFLKLEADEAAAKREPLGQRKAGTRPSLPVAGYAGEYHHPAYETGKVTADGGKLAWEWGAFRAPLEHWQDDVFRVTQGFFEDQFVEFDVANGRPRAVRAMGVVFGRK